MVGAWRQVTVGYRHDRTLLVWDVGSGARLAVARVLHKVHSLAWSEDGRWGGWMTRMSMDGGVVGRYLCCARMMTDWLSMAADGTASSSRAERGTSSSGP